MVNDILYKRVCKLIAIHYALNEETVWEAFQKYNSVDKVLDVIAQGELKGV